MKKILSLAALLCAAFSLSAAAELPSLTNSPDWLVFVNSDGYLEVYDDGCYGSVDVIFEDMPNVTFTFGDKC